MSEEPYVIHHGDNKDVLKELPDNSVDSIVTDGPYGIGFMGKKWDNFTPTNLEALTADHQPIDHKKQRHRSASMHSGEYNLSQSANFEFQQWFHDRSMDMIRVLKPGGHLISFGSTRTYHRMVCGIEDAGFEIRDTLNWIFASGFPKSRNRKDLGLGSALKPAFEPICLARKPLIGTMDENYAQYGTGYLNIDACRIPGEAWRYGSQPDIRNAKYNPGENNGVFARNVVGGQNGRWPANLLHDGSDEVLVVFPESDGQVAAVGPQHGDRPSVNTYGDWGARPLVQPRGDTGSAARFFFCAKTSRTDRNEGCDHLPNNRAGLNSNTSGQHITRRDQDWNPDPVKNNHPTVKPTNLMRYLIRLVTPEGGLVLDPFMGSGSTGKAAMYEYCRFMGIEKQAEYIPIATARIEFALQNRNRQLSIF